MIRKTIIFLCFILQFSLVYGQLSFCEGDLGDPIFTEDFGTGTMNGPALDTSVTTYTYVDSGPEDGFYTISSQLQQHACTIVQVAVSRERYGTGAFKPKGMNLAPF